MTPTRKLITAMAVITIGGISLLIVLLRLGVLTPTPNSARGTAKEKAPPDRYLDSRTGAALERTAKTLISQFGYRCDRIRSIKRMERETIVQIEADDGRWVDCGVDGLYAVAEMPEGFKVVKR